MLRLLYVRYSNTRDCGYEVLGIYSSASKDFLDAWDADNASGIIATGQYPS